MYLETILKNLLEEQKATTAAINNLTAFLSGEEFTKAREDVKGVEADVPKTPTSEAKEEPEAKEVASVTHDTLKADLMALSKADTENRKKIKELLRKI